MTLISLFNLNIMHGRNLKSPIFPLRVSRKQAENNLQKIADLIKKFNSDVVILQEVDQFSVLSGGFNQFHFLADKLNYFYKYFAPSCSAIFLDKNIFVSGTAIFSKYPLENCESFNFSFSFPTERKGFIIADLKLPHGQVLTVVSIHLVWLDWLRFNSRSHQLDMVRHILSKKKNPVILAGDMNCDFASKEKSLRLFVDDLDLKVYEPESKNLNTYPSWKPTKRIDWAFLSKEIDFFSYKTIDERVSDHLAVFATVSIT
ncbi:MAG: endonuclease/exonuclease/phosphatase family protein [Patescibacteria group bacterium]